MTAGKGRNAIELPVEEMPRQNVNVLNSALVRLLSNLSVHMSNENVSDVIT